MMKIKADREDPDCEAHQTLRLVKAFHRLTDPGIRRSVILYVKEKAGENETLAESGGSPQTTT